MKNKLVNHIAFNDSEGEFCISLGALRWLSDRGWEKAHNLLCELNSSSIRDLSAVKVDETMIGMERHSPLLALCIKDMGSEKASGPGASLQIRETVSNLYIIKTSGLGETVVVPEDIVWTEIK